MFSLRVEIFGLPSNVTQRDVDVNLNDGAVISDLVAALRRAIPTLEGDVIRNGEDTLTDMYTFNINGYFVHNNERLELKAGDRVALLLIATGG